LTGRSIRPKAGEGLLLCRVICIHGGGFRAGFAPGGSTARHPAARQARRHDGPVIAMAPRPVPAACTCQSGRPMAAPPNAGEVRRSRSRPQGVRDGRFGGRVTGAVSWPVRRVNADSKERRVPERRATRGLVVNYYGPGTSPVLWQEQERRTPRRSFPCGWGGDREQGGAPPHILGQTAELFGDAETPATTLCIPGTEGQVRGPRAGGMLIDRVRPAIVEAELYAGTAPGTDSKAPRRRRPRKACAAFREDFEGRGPETK